MYVFKTILTLCACLLCAWCAASLMYHMQNFVGYSAGLLFIAIALFIFDLNERDHQDER